MSARQIAPFLDPRYKDLEHEAAADAREKIRKKVKSLLYDISEHNSDMQIPISETKNNSGALLAFLYSDKDCNTAGDIVQYQKTF